MIADIIPKIAAEEQGAEYKFSPRPSLAGPERCIRSLVYYGLETPRDPWPGRAVMIFDDSSWHEELTADWIRRTTFDLHSEQMIVSCRPPMRNGHIDYIATSILGEDIHIEHKAINHFTFNKYWNGGELPKDNLTQTAIYNEAIQRGLNPACRRSLLLIKNKNTAQYMEFLCLYDIDKDTLWIEEKTHSTGETEKMDYPIDNIVKSACDKFDTVLDYVNRKTLPKRPYDIDHWRCEYCPYGKTCWDGYEKEFKELKTNTMLPNEIVDTIRYYRELGAQKKDIEGEYKDLSKVVKNIMKNAGAREGKAGQYICKMILVKSERLEKELIPKKTLQKATKTIQYERLSVREVST
jgi:hypothetical protein